MFKNVKRGAMFGFVIGGVVWMLTAVLRLRSGFVAGPGLLALGAVFVAGGIAGGIVVGTMGHLTRWWMGAIVVGFAGALPVIGGIALLEDGHISAANIEAVVWVSIILGCPTGLIFRYLWRKIDPLGPL